MSNNSDWYKNYEAQKAKALERMNAIKKGEADTNVSGLSACGTVSKKKPEKDAKQKPPQNLPPRPNFPSNQQSQNFPNKPGNQQNLNSPYSQKGPQPMNSYGQNSGSASMGNSYGQSNMNSSQNGRFNQNSGSRNDSWKNSYGAKSYGDNQHNSSDSWKNSYGAKSYQNDSFKQPGYGNQSNLFQNQYSNQSNSYQNRPSNQSDSGHNRFGNQSNSHQSGNGNQSNSYGSGYGSQTNAYGNGYGNQSNSSFPGAKMSVNNQAHLDIEKQKLASIEAFQVTRPPPPLPKPQNPPTGTKRKVEEKAPSFNHMMKKVKSDAKLNSNDWQKQYEERKRQAMLNMKK